jgi:hypothetical protein
MFSVLLLVTVVALILFGLGHMAGVAHRRPIETEEPFDNPLAETPWVITQLEITTLSKLYEIESQLCKDILKGKVGDETSALVEEALTLWTETLVKIREVFRHHRKYLDEANSRERNSPYYLEADIVVREYDRKARDISMKVPQPDPIQASNQYRPHVH